MAKILLKLIRLEICALNIQLIHEVESPAFAISYYSDVVRLEINDFCYSYNNIFINGSCDNRYYVLKLHCYTGSSFNTKARRAALNSLPYAACLKYIAFFVSSIE